VPPHQQEYILNHLFGIRGTGQDSHDNRENAPPIPPDEFGERILVACGDRVNECCVGRRRS
jgi:hypothetical protein